MSRVTTEVAPITQPTAGRTPGMMMAPSPIQTSDSISVRPGRVAFRQGEAAAVLVERFADIMSRQLGGDAPLMAGITAVQTVLAMAAIPLVLIGFTAWIAT